MLRLCLGELAAGAARLSLAFELRRGLGDEAGASYSARNLSMASRPRWYTRWVLGHTVLFVGLVLALFAAGVVAAATLPGGGSSATPRTSSGVQGSNSVGATRTNSGHGTTTSNTGSTARPMMSTLTISLAGDGQGQVTVDPGGKVCPDGLQALVQPEHAGHPQGPGRRNVRVRRLHNCSTSTSPCTLTLSGDKTVGAEFEPPATLFLKPAPA